MSRFTLFVAEIAEVAGDFLSFGSSSIFRPKEHKMRVRTRYGASQKNPNC